MEAARPIFFQSKEENIYIKIEEFKLEYKQKEYIISLMRKISVSEKLGFRIKESSLDNKLLYENFYTLEELKIINKYFRIFDNINEIFPIIKEIFEGKSASLKAEDNKIILSLKINKIGKGEELILLEMKESILAPEEIHENLLKEIKLLKNRVTEQEKEIKLLKEKEISDYFNLYEEINQLRNESKKKDNIINELLNWKKDIEKKTHKKKSPNENKINKLTPNFMIAKTEIFNKDVIDSKIVDGIKEIYFIYQHLKKIKLFQINNISFKLIFRATRDGNESKYLHEKVDGLDKTLLIIKTREKFKFGGYINYKWTSSEKWICDDEECFVFSISLRKIYYPIEGKIKYYFNKDYGPNFSVFGIEKNLFEKSSLNIHTAKDANCFFSGFTVDYELTGGKKEFQVEELEVFRIICY